MHSSEISAVGLPTTVFREGYNRDEVDSFMETARQSLQQWEAGRVGELTSSGVVEARFTPTMFRSGYKQGEVDDFLDQIAETLGSYESEQRP
ncbi:DivIVA domain-containing protein [Arthrobacter sp. HLT1-20]